MNQITTKKPNTPLQNALLDCLFDPDVNGDIRKAMTKAGYSENSSVREIIEPIKDQIIELAKTQLALNSPKAVVGLIDVIDSPAQLGANNKLNAANSVLDRVGLTKKDDSALNIPKGAIVLLPPKESNTNINIKSDNISISVETVQQEQEIKDITPIIEQ
jgi:hypothetical protein